MLPTIATGNVASAIGGGYEVANSCRFNDGDSAYMHITPSGAGNRRTFTFSFWFKRSSITILQEIFSSGASGDNEFFYGFRADDTFEIYDYQDATKQHLITNRLFRDVGAWYHFCIIVDTTDGTSANRTKLFVNGIQETSFSTETYPSQNDDLVLTQNQEIDIGRKKTSSAHHIDGYLAEVVFIDGTAYAASNFGEFDEDSPTIWKPKDVSGLTFGTNGFYLDFEDSADLGADVSGNSNDFTVTNLAATDQATDTPTNNFATLNPLNFGHGSLSEGNLKWTASAQVGNLAFGTIGIDMDVSNQFYWETKIEGGEIVIGIAPTTLRWNDTGRAGSYGYYSDGNKYSGTSASSYGASFTTNDIIGVLVGNGTLTFYKNGASQGTAFSSLSGTYLPFLAEVGSTNSMNFGSPPYSISSGNTDPEGYGNFEYSTNSGYALNTKNLSEFG